MKQFQKIAIGLLGLTNPEMFIPRPKPGAVSARKADTVSRPPQEPRLREASPANRAVRALRGLRLLWSALALGSRTVPLADNSRLRRDLQDIASLLYRSSEG